MTTDPPSTSYDLIPYSSTAFPQTHPDRLAVVARLFGVEAADPERCRVLELGAASGGNLIPMACELPQSRFIGVDLSGRQVADGQSTIRSLGLTNVELRQLSITDIGEDLGRFDYIMCHGVYSWVPDAVREHILAVAKKNLAPNGVAYVSYNTYPGWHMRGMIRDMMRYHSGRFSEARQQIDQARSLLNFLATNVSENNPYGMLLKKELEGLQGQPDSYLFHEHLEEVNNPIYFFEFARALSEHGLQYLGEADFSTMLASNFAPKVAEVLRQVAPDIIHMEQYMDFLRNRTFRQSLLVHPDRIKRRNLTPANVKPFFFTCPAKPISTSPDLGSNTAEAFRLPTGLTLTTSHALTKAAMLVMAKHWPEPLSFNELCTASRRLLETYDEPATLWSTAAEDLLAGEMLSAYTAGMVELRPRALGLTREIGGRPLASRIARFQAKSDPKARVVNLRHEPVPLDELKRQVLQRLDGQHDHDMLLDELVGLVLLGKLNVEHEGKKVMDPLQLRSLLERLLGATLSSLALSALLTDR